MNLFEISEEYLAVLAMAEDPDADPEAVAGTMEAVEADFEAKGDAYAHIISQLKADSAGIDAEMKRLRERKASLDANADRLKMSLENAMRMTGKVKFKTALHSFGIQKNPPRCVIDDAEKIPEAFLIRQEPKVDTAGILKMLKGLGDGEKVAWAHMEQGESLRIR